MTNNKLNIEEIRRIHIALEQRKSHLQLCHKDFNKETFEYEMKLVTSACITFDIMLEELIEHTFENNVLPSDLEVEFKIKKKNERQ